MQSAPIKAANNQPSRTQPPAPDRRPVRRHLRRVTVIVGSLITLFVIGLMSLSILGIWPPKATEAQPEATIKQTSVYAKELAIEKNGAPHADPTNTGQLIVPLKAVNNVKQAELVTGTPTPGVTPTVGPARVLSASVKVLFYNAAASDPNKKVIGTGYGGFNAQPNGIAPGASFPFEVIATGITPNGYKDYEAFADLLHTDRDPIKKEEEATSPVSSPTSIPLGTSEPQAVPTP